MKKWLKITALVVGTACVTTAIVAPTTYVAANNSNNEKYVSVKDMFINSKLYQTSSEQDRDRMLKQYDGVYVETGSKLWKQYNNLFNPKGGNNG